MQKNIFLLWLQGWDKAPWLSKQVAESWEINNPGWTIHYIDFENLKDYVTDIDYIYDTSKNISPQAKSDIIRLSLLKNHGGVWADATMLCMQPLDPWVYDAVEPAGFWMYHGNGAGMAKEIGPASWFVISKKNSYMIQAWKNACDIYWTRSSAHDYFWMDTLFKILFENDPIFKQTWLKAPYLYCELDGQSHTLHHHSMFNDTPYIKKLFMEKPPYALKLWKTWNDVFSDGSSLQCKQTNAFYAIQMSKRKVSYIHTMT